MAEIKHIRGIRYNQEKIGSFEKVITLPYDKIEPELQKDYYERSPFNFVRIILGNDEIEGKEEKYAKARAYIQNWLNENVLIQDNDTCFYPYTQEYEVDGVKKIRFSFIGALKVSDYSEGVVIPHENTLSGPKKDRRRLLEETESHTELIFMLFQDKANNVKALMTKAMSEKPISEMTDDDGTIHRVYKLADNDSIAKISEFMKDRKVFIADGHHRYETSLGYSKDQKNNPEAAYTLCAFVNMDDTEGLTILPTHRVVKNVSDFSKELLLKKLEENFEIQKADNLEKLNSLLSENEKSFGLLFPDEFYLIRLKNKKIVEKLITEKVSLAYKLLDVVILHQLILEKLLGIDKVKLEEKTNLEYIRGYKKAYETLTENSYQCAFLLSPTKIEELSEVASLGDKMPQKSTDFYPKLLSGFVFHKLKN